MKHLLKILQDLPEVSLGDEVVLMGEGVTADEIADLTGTIHYELTCQLTERVPRIWISDCE